MYFTDRSLLPGNQPPLIRAGARYGPTWIPSHFPEDIAVSWDEQVHKAIDCFEAGAPEARLSRACPGGVSPVLAPRRP